MCIRKGRPRQSRRSSIGWRVVSAAPSSFSACYLAPGLMNDPLPAEEDSGARTFHPVLAGCDPAVRMRILHVVPTYLPATRYGGPIYAVHGLCRALAARGHDVTVFTTN